MNNDIFIVDGDKINKITEIGERKKKLTIPDGIKVIGDRAFWGTKRLKTISLPNGLRRIGEMAFYCSGIEKIKAPDSVSVIGDEAFCQSCLVEVELPKKLKTLRLGLFQYCKDLTTVTIHNGVKSIQMNSFFGCENLKTIKFLGTEEQWAKIKINEYTQDDLSNVQIEFITK